MRNKGEVASMKIAMRQGSCQLPGYCRFDHYACFQCRRSFKKGTLGFTDDGPKAAKGLIVLPWPECGGDLRDMGHHFSPPKRRDIKAWEVVMQLYRVGYFKSHESWDIKRRDFRICYGPEFKHLYSKHAL